MARHAHTEMKTQDHQDNDKERVPINQEMDKQPNRGKRKHDDEEDDRKPTVKPKKKMMKITKTMMIKITKTIMRKK